ncbi:hypothetical protein BD310DRAFT_914274, partial [Dichomitus squalens]
MYVGSIDAPAFGPKPSHASPTPPGSNMKRRMPGQSLYITDSSALRKRGEVECSLHIAVFD